MYIYIYIVRILNQMVTSVLTTTTTTIIIIIISEFNKLAQKQYKIRHNWVAKVIHWELCKKLKFDHMDK